MVIYGCEKKDNECPQKDSCNRYLLDYEMVSTLWRTACTDGNNKILYIKHEEKPAE